MRIKICGITRVEDMKLSVKLGAWALGFNFFDGSPRYIAPEAASHLIEELPASALPIGVFVNASLSEVQAVARTSGIRMIQLHGDETPEFCAEASRACALPVIKAVHPQTAADLRFAQAYRGSTSYLLVDAKTRESRGGTGMRADWVLSRDLALMHPLILAGGIGPANAREAIAAVRPFALDVCSGVEDQPGIKSESKLKALFEAVKEKVKA